MRTLNGQETAVINCQDGYSVRARVWVWNGTAYQDVTSLEGRDWLVSVEWDESVNEPCAQATVQLRRRQEDLSLNPLVSNKLTGVLALARAFYIETATIPLGDAPEATDWREVFRGQIESLDLEKDPITFVGRDDAGKLLRHFIEFDATYGSAGGTAVESVMTSILTDNGWTALGVSLYTPVSPSVVRGKFKQKKMATLLALREQALTIGWDLRQWWDSGTSAFRLTLRNPDRTGSAGSQWTFQPGQVRAVTRMKQTLSDVRNTGRLWYYNRSALDSGGKPTRAYVDSSAATSISTYGRLWMQLSEDEDSPVDSPAEAQAMLDAAVADLKDPLLDLGVEVGFHYGIQLGDLLTFAADDDNFSSAQTLAVVSAAHRINRKGHRTSLTLRGKPVGAHDDWLRRESRAVRQAPSVTPDTLSGMTATATQSGAIVSFTAPTVPPFPAEYELHVSTSSGFTPSSSTLRERANRTNFEVTGLSPSTTYYAKVVPRTAAGGQGTASAEVTISPRYVEPRTLQPFVALGLPPNSDFEAHNDTAQPPDTWSMMTVEGAGSTMTVWGTDVKLHSTAFAGARALAFTKYGARIGSQAMVVTPGGRYGASLIAATNNVGDGVIPALRIAWLASNFSTVSSTEISNVIVTYAAGWKKVENVVTAPSTARYARIEVFPYITTGSGEEMYLDSVSFVLYTGPRPQWTDLRTDVSDYRNGFGPYGTSGWDTPGHMMNQSGEVIMRGLVATPAAGVAANTSMFVLPQPPPTNKQIIGMLASSFGAVYVEVQPDGTVITRTAVPASGGGWISLVGLRYHP